MKPHRSQLESGDNWLQKEIERESRISAWDLDDGRKVREEHNENCDARDAAEFHEQRHRRRSRIDYDATGGNEGPKRGPSAWFFIDMIFLFVLIFVRIIAPYNLPTHFAPAIILFLGINPGIFIWLFAAKKFPPENYWKALFVIVLLLELVFAFLFHPQVYYY